MDINYCDLCNNPTKSEKYILVIAKESELIKSTYGNNFQRETFDTCESCKNIIMNIFKLKKDKLKQITDQIEREFKL